MLGAELVSTGIGAGRVLTGLIGRGILQSRTPWLHEQEGDAQGLRLVYALFDFNDRGWSDTNLPALLDATQLIGFAGLNVTFPFKQAVIELLDELSGSAREVGAVNTIAFRDGRRIGYNTDVSGFAEGFLAQMADGQRDHVLQLGCGGAGAATAHALLSKIGARQVTLADTDAARMQRLHAHLAEVYGAGRVRMTADPAEAMRSVDGLVNATPIGMDKFPGLPITASAIEQRHWVADIVYFPLETALLAEARRKGCRTLDGSGMAVGQAADAFSIFTGLSPNRQRMRDSFAAFASGKGQVAA